MLKSNLSKFKCELCQQMQQVIYQVVKIYLDFCPFKFNDNKHWHDISLVISMLAFRSQCLMPSMLEG
jgi:hypothetical protein